MTDIVGDIHASPWQGVIAITGCGPGLVNDLLSPGGGSATLLEAVVPYAPKSLQDFIKFAKPPEKYCSQEIATEMASAAFSRATELSETGTSVFGLGITATLRKRGDEREGRVHQVFLSFQTAFQAYEHHIIFNNKLSRILEEHLVSQVALDVLARYLLDFKRHRIRNLDGKLASPEWLNKETTERLRFPEGLQRLLRGEDTVWDHIKDAAVSLEHRTKRVIIPGSFNPFHGGHGNMVKVAREQYPDLGTPVLELSISNVDKGKLSGYEILKRGKEFHKGERLEFVQPSGSIEYWVTDAPSFLEKSIIFPESVFVIGIDTWYRLNDRKYYQHSNEMMKNCLGKIRENGCRFMVLGRFINGSYHTLPDHDKTEGFATGLSEETFRVDISSTEIRSKGPGNP
jgi:hypothetical protein